MYDYRPLGLCVKRRVLYFDLIIVVADKKRFDVVEIRCQTSVCSVTQMERVGNKEVRRRKAVLKDLTGWAEQCVFGLFVMKIVTFNGRCELAR